MTHELIFNASLMQPLYNERELLLRISKGDEQAFRLLYDSFNAMVYATINRYIADDEECCEQLQEIFITIWEKRHLLPEVERLDNYLFIMARNSVLRHVGQLQKQFRLLKQYQYSQSPKQQFSDESAYLPSVELREYQLRWQEAINSLPSQQKQVYILIEQEDLPLDDTASQLGLAKETVKKHLKLARRSVRSYISGYLKGSGEFPEILLIITAFLFL